MKRIVQCAARSESANLASGDVLTGGIAPLLQRWIGILSKPIDRLCKVLRRKELTLQEMIPPEPLGVRIETSVHVSAEQQRDFDHVSRTADLTVPHAQALRKPAEIRAPRSRVLVAL